MAAETQYTMNTGMVTVSTANSLLDGTGSLGTVLTAASNGTLIKTVTIKAQVSTTQGMVRLFLTFNNGEVTVTKLIREVEIPAVTKSAADPAFETVVPLNFCLKSGWILKASTEKAESFNVIAEGQNWAYYTSSVRTDTTKYTAYNNAASIATANTNLDGTGIMSSVLASSGTNVQGIVIKSIQNTTAGMVRLFLYDGTNTKLFREVSVEAVTKSSTASAFQREVRFDEGFALKSGWEIRVSTEKAETFKVISESLDLSYPA